jgi:hypothetical protein
MIAPRTGYGSWATHAAGLKFREMLEGEIAEKPGNQSVMEQG